MAFRTLASSLLGVASGGSGSLGTLFVRLTADSAGLVAGMNSAQSSLTSTTEQMVKTLTVFSLAAGAALAAVGVAAVKQASDFESSFAGVRKTVDATESQFAHLEASFRRMAREIPVDVNEINKVAEAAGQLGIKTEDITGFTRVMIDLGKTTNLSSEQGATELARFANITEMSGKNFSRLGSTVVDLGNKFAGTESEIVGMALRIAGAGHTLKMSEAQILGIATALSSVGIEAEMGGSAISQVMIKMAKAVEEGGEKLQLFAGTAGMSASAFKEAFQKNAAGAIEKFLIGLKAFSTQGGEVFGLLDRMDLDGIRVGDTLLRASSASGQFSNAIKVGTEAWNANNALTEEANKRYATFASQVTITWNLIKDGLITIGQSLIPALKALNSMLQEAMGGADGLGESFKNFVSSVGPIFIGAIGAIGDALYGWKLILKGGETAFLGLATFVTTVFGIMAEAVRIVVSGMVDGFVGSINFAIRAVNMLLPEAKKISEIKFSFQIDTSAFRNAQAAAKAAFDESFKELGQEVEGGTFSARVTKAYEKATAVVQTENKKIVADVKATADQAAQVFDTSFVQRIDATKRATDTINEMSKQMPNEGMGLGRGLGGFEDPRMRQAGELKAEMDKAQEKLRILNDLGSQELDLEEEVQIKKLNMIKAYNERYRALQAAQTQFVLQTSSQIFNDLANIAENFAGKQSGIYTAMFAVSKAFAIADAIIKIQQGIAAAASLPWPANLGAIASVVAATSSIVSNIRAVKLQFGGAKEMGGPVSSGRAFLVGEKGPEMFVPSDNGTIVPNNRMGGGSVKVVINNFTDAQASVTEKTDSSGKVIEVMIRRVKEEIASEVRDGRGPVNRAMEQSFNLRRGTK